MPTYSEKLRDPRWQRKRLEVLEAAEFMCQECCAEDRTLHVHHGYYRRGAAPWEYEDETLHVVCEDCHPKVQEMLAEVHREIGRLSECELDWILTILRANAEIGLDRVAYLTSEMVEGRRVAVSR